MGDEIFDDDLSQYDIYGKTPPRTKILRKFRERKHKDKFAGPSQKMSKAKVLSRRNTVTTMYDDLIARSENNESDQGGSSKKVGKRQMKLLRGSERDLKLDIASAQAVSHSDESNASKTPQPSYQIGSCKRFMSLSVRTVPCPKSRSHTDHDKEIACEEGDNNECYSKRVEFYKTLSLLIRMGYGEKQSQDRNPRKMLSREEFLWQNEIKDLIWLELQAFHADRTCMEEDTYLCTAREMVEPLLKDIMNYRYKRHTKIYSTQNSDSGIEDECSGCVSMYCNFCMEAQNQALHDIEELSKRLEEAEALFPSNKAFAELYPLYSSPEIVGRVKAISLWYNMVKHQRLKLLILGRLLEFLESKSCQWPVFDMKVSFNSTGSPSDSNNSSSSSANDYMDGRVTLDYYNLTPLAHLAVKNANSVSPYRKYIENILKTRALNKSLNFLDKLHQHVLRKAQITLEKPDSDELFTRNNCETEEEELMRYGCWSPEAKALNLPSYKASFLFLAAVPIEVIHQFLIMRLEQKPDNPSPLSVRQLMRELKEGLKIATVQRKRMDEYIYSATKGTTESVDIYLDKLKAYDECLFKVFSVYLDYLQQWALLQHETFQKNLLEEEWQYSCSIINYIPNGSELLGNKFCFILSSILKSIGERLIEGIDELLNDIPEDEDVKHNIFAVCRELQTLFNEEREMSIKTMSFCKTVLKHDMLSDESTRKLEDAIIAFKCIIPDAIARVQKIFEHTNTDLFDESEKASLISRIREILMQGYKFGFEFYKEMSDIDANKNCGRRQKLVRSMIQFANLWMKFVIEKCDRGRGMRPRWAYQGLEFLLAVCEPRNTKYLTDDEFEDLKQKMDICISHVIGTTAPSTPESGFYSASPRSSLARSRGSSPSPRPCYKSQRSAGRKTSADKMSSPSEHLDSPTFETVRRCESLSESVVKIKLPPSTHSERVRDAVEALENELDEKLRKQELIGRVVRCDGSGKIHVRQRYVNFTWQRGIKIGQGRFGKVYTAVNNNTGEMMAVKEISLLCNDSVTIKRVAEEMKILEGIVHKNLVRYYGMEVHKEEMLLFMEYCAEGTLENLIAATENGLPEGLVRRYTYQLVCAVACLHDHGIVHRDIKTANIFLTDEGNCLKIGDFGCAAKIKNHTTMPGELKGFVGTQAYMAPEVFTKNMNEGHGRAADIWSVGCVVVEMASGKRPWAQYDSNYQIMFKVGMGDTPDPPEDFIDEGLDFLSLCFKFDPKERATAHELLDHNFVKVGNDL